jgi:hypothetical protein
MFGRPRTLLTIAACLMAMPVAAQAPAPTTAAFDGKYVGTATLTGGRQARSTSGPLPCGTITSVDMTITGGQVVIHEIFFNGGRPSYRGIINAAGEVSAWRQTQNARAPYVNVYGTVHDNLFTGQRVHFDFDYSIQMHKDVAPATTAFDGTYIGVSKTIEGVSGGGYDQGCAKNPRPGPLTIVNGSAAWAGDVEGSVTPQGLLVMSNPSGARFDGRIDGQGTLTGWFTAGCSYRLVWQKK